MPPFWSHNSTKKSLATFVAKENKSLDNIKGELYHYIKLSTNRIFPMKEENYSTSNKYLWVDARIRWGVRLFSMPIAWTFFLQYVPVVVCVCSSSRSFPNANISSMICMRHSSWSNRQWRLQLLSFLHSSSPFEQWYCSWRCQWKISNNVRLCTPIAKIVDCLTIWEE